MYFSGQGKLFVAALVAGVPGSFRWVGNVPNFAPAFATEKFEHKESYSGQRLNDKVITTGNNTTISASLEDWSKENLALAVRGAAATTPATPVTGEVAPAALVAGDIWALKGQKVSAVTITDSTSGTPLTVDAADYTLDAAFGTVVMKDVAGYVQPFKAAYTPSAVAVIPFFTQPITEVAVRFEGVNTADGNKKVLVDIYKVALDPTKELGLITEQLGQFTLEGNALLDSTKTADDPVFGQFGRMLYLDA